MNAKDTAAKAATKNAKNKPDAKAQAGTRYFCNKCGTVTYSEAWAVYCRNCGRRL